MGGGLAHAAAGAARCGPDPFVGSPHADRLACHRNERSTPSPFPYMNNRRTLITAVVGGGLLLGAAGVGIVYFLIFPSSSPQKLALSSATPTSSASTANSASAPGAGHWNVTTGSQAGYRVSEQLAS